MGKVRPTLKKIKPKIGKKKVNTNTTKFCIKSAQIKINQLNNTNVLSKNIKPRNKSTNLSSAIDLIIENLNNYFEVNEYEKAVVGDFRYTDRFRFPISSDLIAEIPEIFVSHYGDDKLIKKTLKCQLTLLANTVSGYQIAFTHAEILQNMIKVYPNDKFWIIFKFIEQLSQSAFPVFWYMLRPNSSDLLCRFLLDCINGFKQSKVMNTKTTFLSMLQKSLNDLIHGPKKGVRYVGEDRTEKIKLNNLINHRFFAIANMIFYEEIDKVNVPDLDESLKLIMRYITDYLKKNLLTVDKDDEVKVKELFYCLNLMNVSSHRIEISNLVEITDCLMEQSPIFTNKVIKDDSIKAVGDNFCRPKGLNKQQKKQWRTNMELQKSMQNEKSDSLSETSQYILREFCTKININIMVLVYKCRINESVSIDDVFFKRWCDNLKEYITELDWFNDNKNAVDWLHASYQVIQSTSDSEVYFNNALELVEVLEVLAALAFLHAHPLSKCKKASISLYQLIIYNRCKFHQKPPINPLVKEELTKMFESVWSIKPSPEEIDLCDDISNDACSTILAMKAGRFLIEQDF